MFFLHFRVCWFKKRYPGAGVVRAALTRGRSPPAHLVPGSSLNQNSFWLMLAPVGQGWLRPCVREARAREFPLATGGRGRTRHSGAWPEPPAEKTVFVKHQPKLYLVDVWYQMSTKTLPGWCLISNINRNCIWLMFDIKRQPKLYLVDVWYQMSTRTASRLMFDIKHQPELHPVDVWYQTSIRTLSGWCLISIIKRVATG